MLKALLPLFLCLLLVVPIEEPAVTDVLHTGQLLRMHVIAADDSPAMQAVKYPVRDAVRSLYAAQADSACSMLENAERLLPQLTEAAQAAAAKAGYQGEVVVLLGSVTFDARRLDGLTVPAGDYPALIVRLGEGRGHNWWGLLDPRRSLLAASLEWNEGASVVWDWSPAAFLQALLRSFTHVFGGAAV